MGESKPRVLVTGSLGFVGGALVDRLVQQGYPVRAIDIRDQGGRDGIDYRRCDITDQDAVGAVVDGVDLIFHTASLVQTRQTEADLVWRVNHQGTLNLLEAARAAGVGRFVQISSASVVYEGRDIENGDEALPYAGVSQAPYADSKIAAERDVLAAHDPDGLRTCAIRPHVVFGPGDGRFIPALIDRAKAGRLKMGVGRGEKLSDFTYIDNLVDALVGAADDLANGCQTGGQAYFVTNGEPLPFWTFIDKVLVAMDQPPTKGRVPYRLAYSVAAAVEAFNALRRKGGPETGMTRFAIRYMCTHHYFSIEKAKRDFGYTPAIDIDEGIARTIQHLRDAGTI